MIGYNEDINELYVKLFDFLKQYEALDDMAPFTPEFLQDVKKIITEFKKSSDEINEHYLKQIKKYEKCIAEIVNEYNTKNKKLDDELTQKLYDIRTEYDKNVKAIKNTIVSKKEASESKKANLDFDVECYISASEQNIEMIHSEHDENIRRFEYQNENSKISYTTSIATNNNALESELKKLKSEYDVSLKNYDIETKKIIANYEDEINSTNELLNEAIEEFNVIQKNHKESKYEHSVNLNNKIRTLADETNQRIVNERLNYTEDQNSNQQKRDEKHQTNLEESQKVSREFVLNMTALDEKADEIKRNYGNQYDILRRQYEYTVFEITRDLEAELKEIYSFGYDQKKTRKLIKQKHKEYSSFFKIEKGKNEKEINFLDENYLTEIEKNNYEKKLLDIERTYRLKELTEIENRDNKHFQESNNLDEADLNYQIAVINNEYNKNANIIRLEASITSEDLDSEYEKIAATHQKKTENFQSKIRRIRTEMESTKSLYDLMHKHVNDKYNKTVNYKIVHNLLEIEKCKVLSTYNNETYALNRENADIVLSHSKESINIQNEKFKALKDIDKDIDSKITEGDIADLEYKLDILKEKLEYDINSITTKNKYEHNSILHDLLEKRYKYEIKCIEQSATNFSLLLSDLELLLTRTLDKLFEHIVIDDESIEMLRTFNKRIVAIMFEYYTKIYIGADDEQKEFIDSRLQFEEEFKFKSNYEESNKIYDAEFKALSIEKRGYQDSLDDIIEHIDTITRQSFTIQGQIAYLKDPKNKKKGSKTDVKNNIKKLNERLKEIKEDTAKSEIKAEELKRNIVDVTIKIANVEKISEQKKNEIKLDQYNNDIAYHNYKKSIDKLLDDVTAMIKDKIFNDTETANGNNYEAIIHEKRHGVVMFDNKLRQSFYKAIFDFHQEAIKNSNKYKAFIEDGYVRDCDELKNSYDYTLKNKKNQFTKISENIANDLFELTSTKAQLEDDYDEKLIECDKRFDDNTMKNIESKHNSTEKFYNEYYAVCDNQKDLDEAYTIDMIKIDDVFDSDKRQLIADNLKKDQEIKDSLKSFIEKRDDLIKTIPENTKLKKIETATETKERNRELDNSKVQARIEYNIRHKELEKNVEAIDVQLQASIAQLELEKKNLLLKERKDHSNELKRIAR